MSASPPGWGLGSSVLWCSRLAAHVAGLVAGALATTGALFALAAALVRAPLWLIGAMAAVFAISVAGLLPVEFEGSPWRVPRSWARFGVVGYAFAFGAALGTGLATRLASPGTYVVVAWSVVAPRWSLVWPVALAYAVGRAAPFLAVAVRAWRRRVYAADALEPVARIAGLLGPAEAMALAVLAVWWLVP